MVLGQKTLLVNFAGYKKLGIQIYENDGPVSRQKDRKDGDHRVSNNSVLQELWALSSKMDGIKSALERQLNSKVDRLCDSMEKLVKIAY